MPMIGGGEPGLSRRGEPPDWEVCDLLRVTHRAGQLSLTIETSSREEVEVLQPEQHREGRRLFAEMYGRLRRFAGAVGPWDMEPDDLLQEALVRTLRLGPLARLDNPEAYLRRTITNLARNHAGQQVRARHVQRSLETRDAVTTKPSYPSDLSDLLELNPIGRAVVFLHDVEGHSFGEVGELLGITEANSRQIAARARQVLRRRIEQEV